jgi:hypothetical protein
MINNPTITGQRTRFQLQANTSAVIVLNFVNDPPRQFLRAYAPEVPGGWA